MPHKNIVSLSTILLVTVLVVSLIGVGFVSSPVAAQSTPSDADAYLEDGGTYTQGQTLYRDDLESYELVNLYNDETGEHIYTRRANENGEFYIPTEFNSPSTYRLEGEKSGTVATYTLEASQENTDNGDGDSGTSGAITFQDYYGDGEPVTEVTVQEATLNEGGFLAVYKNGQFITASDHLSEGTHQDVVIDISSDPVDELSTIRIAPYKDSNGDGQFDSNDDSYWGEDSAKSSLAQYGPEEVPPTEPWGTPNDGDDPTDDPNNDDDNGVFTPGGGDDPNSGDNNGDNPEGNLPSIPAFLTNPIFLIGGVVFIVLVIIGILIARQVMGGTGFEDYDPEKDGEPTEEQDPATTATDGDTESPDPTRVDGTTGPTPTQEGPPGATGTTASGSDTTSSEEEKGFGGVTPQEDLPTPVQGEEEEEESIQTTEDDEQETESEPEPEAEEDEEDVQPPTPVDEIEDGDSEENVVEMDSETDVEKMDEPKAASEPEPTDDAEEDEGYGPEPDEEIPPQPDMEDDVVEEPVEEETTESESEPEPEPEPDEPETDESDQSSEAEQDVGMEDTDAIQSEKFVEEAKEEQVPDEPDVEDDTDSPSTQYDSTKDPMYGEDTPPAPLHEMEEEEEPEPEPEEPETDGERESEEEQAEPPEDESEEDGGLGFFGRLRSGLTPDTPDTEEVVDEGENEPTEEAEPQEVETEPEEDEEEDDILDDIVAEREVEDEEEDKEDKEPSATDLVDGGDDEDDDPFSNV